MQLIDKQYTKKYYFTKEKQITINLQFNWNPEIEIVQKRGGNNDGSNRCVALGQVKLSNWKWSCSAEARNEVIKVTELHNLVMESYRNQQF